MGNVLAVLFQAVPQAVVWIAKLFFQAALVLFRGLYNVLRGRRFSQNDDG